MKLFGKKKYQITPIELVKWAEPLFGDEEAPAQGLSQELVASYEAAAGFQIPAALREYYLACGKASLNEMPHPILTPDKDAKPFGGHLSAGMRASGDRTWTSPTRRCTSMTKILCTTGHPLVILSPPS